ncbi:MAG: AI-2E family transporter [Leptolyngbyaceae cyanobacterium CSU_1_3]|nr:AI-2E family transporter [Leptolyngbyaceae cyanobacterium CSU_1_3]
MGLGKWVGLFSFVVSLYILWEMRQVLLLVFAAVIFATALNSLVRRLQQAGFKRGGATALSIAVFAFLLVIFVGIIVPPFIKQFQQLVELVPKGFDNLQNRFQDMQNMIPGYSEYLPGVDDLIRQIQPLAGRFVGNFFSLFSNVLAIVLNLLLVIILTVMLLINPQPYRRGVVLLFPSFYRRRTDEILSLCEVALVNWVGGILINMVVIGVVSGISLWILGVPLVLANALLAGLLEAIPNVGPVLSLVPPAAIALLEAPWKAGAVVILYIVIQQLEQYLLVPFVMSKQLSLLPAVTLLSQVVFAIFFGFLGLFLAIPLVLVGQIWVREVLIRDVLDPWQSDRYGKTDSEFLQAEEPLPEMAENLERKEEG